MNRSITLLFYINKIIVTMGVLTMEVLAMGVLTRVRAYSILLYRREVLERFKCSLLSFKYAIYHHIVLCVVFRISRMSIYI